MGSSLAKNDIHIVFHIKYHSMEIRDEDLGQVFAYIGGLIRNMGGIPMEIGGIGNHIHILTTLPKTIALYEFVKNIKAYSSKWIKTIDERYYEGFAWQKGYGVFSVSYNTLDNVVHYIRNQAEHHHRTDWRDEYKQLMDEAGVEYMTSGGRLRRIDFCKALKSKIRRSQRANLHHRGISTPDISV